MMTRTAIALFEAINDSIMRMVVMEVEDEEQSVIEIAEIDLNDRRSKNISILMRVFKNSGLEFEITYKASWEVDLGRAQLTESKIGKIIDAYPGKDACGDQIEIADLHALTLNGRNTPIPF
jgi:hypothetical protein